MIQSTKPEIAALRNAIMDCIERDRGITADTLDELIELHLWRAERKQSGGGVSEHSHASDCATHNAPALPPEECDCDDCTEKEVLRREPDWKHRYYDLLRKSDAEIREKDERLRTLDRCIEHIGIAYAFHRKGIEPDGDVVGAVGHVLEYLSSLKPDTAKPTLHPDMGPRAQLDAYYGIKPNESEKT